MQFVNPQANLLCPKTRGSVVLGVAAATLVGRDLGVFYCCPSEASASGAGSAGAAPGHDRRGRGADAGRGGGASEGSATWRRAGGLAVHQKHERLLTVAGALAYVMSLDVDVNAGVCWLRDVQVRRVRPQGSSAGCATSRSDVRRRSGKEREREGVYMYEMRT